MPPRLKACSECSTLNAPRSFYCKQCNHPFYSQEYLGVRGFAKPVEELIPVEPKSFEPATAVIEQFLSKVGDIVMAGVGGCTEPVFELRVIDQENEKRILVPEVSCWEFCENNIFLNCGKGAVTSVAFAGSRFLACLVGNTDIVVWIISETGISGKNYHFESNFSQPKNFIKSVTFVRYLWTAEKAVLAILFLDRVELWQVSNAAGDMARVWSSQETIPSPSCVDARLIDRGDGNFGIELLVGSAISEGVYLVQITPEYTLAGARVFVEKNWCSVVGFLQDPNFFLTGLGSGESISLWDGRDTRGPISVMSNAVGNRRFLTDLTVSDSDPAIAFAAFQSGTVLNFSSSAELLTMQPIGGEVKSAQCFGMDAIGSRVFAAMSSGVVLTLDLMVRDKLKRAMTDYVGIWEGENLENPRAIHNPIFSNKPPLESKLFDSLATNPFTNVTCRIVPPKSRTKQLKHLRATDGASNEREPSEGKEAVPVLALRTNGDWVACGTAVGIVHLFRYRGDN